MSAFVPTKNFKRFPLVFPYLTFTSWDLKLFPNMFPKTTYNEHHNILVKRSFQCSYQRCPCILKFKARDLKPKTLELKHRTFKPRNSLNPRTQTQDRQSQKFSKPYLKPQSLLKPKTWTLGKPLKTCWIWLLGQVWAYVVDPLGPVLGQAPWLNPKPTDPVLGQFWIHVDRLSPVHKTRTRLKTQNQVSTQFLFIYFRVPTGVSFLGQVL